MESQAEEKREGENAAHENWEAYQRGIDAGHGEYVELATKCDNFYRGDQWDKADKGKLEAEGRPALTINAVKAAVNAVLGEYSKQRVDFNFKPGATGLDETAVALSKVAQQVQDANHYDDVEAMVFADGLIQDRGYFDIRMDFERNRDQGEIKITSEDPIDVIPDPTAKEFDPSTWREVTKSRWLSLEEVTLYYGKDKADEIKANVGGVESSYGQDSIRFNQQTFGDSNIYEMSASDCSLQIRRVRIIERQHYKVREALAFVDPNTGDERDVPPGWEKARAVAFAKQMNLFIYRRTVRAVRWTISADHVVLHDDWSPYKTFTIVPFFPYWRRGRPTGMVRDLLSPQEQLNKVESQQLHIVNTTANSGWVVESGSIMNMTEDEIESRGAETGLVLIYGKGRTPPSKIQPNQVPTGLDRFGSKALNYIREISGMASMLGVESAEVSGVALEAKQQRGLAQMDVPFDNLRMTRRLVAEKILELIQTFYTETRIVRTTNYGSLQRESETTTINGMTPEGLIINDVTLGTYDVTVSMAPARDTYQDSQFAEALNLRKVGVMVPDHWVITYSNLSDKLAVAKEVQQLQGMAPPTDQELQLQQMQLQMQIQSAQLELQKMAAEIQELQSIAQLNQAKAQVAVGDLQISAQKAQADAQAKMATIQSSFVQKMQDLQNKLQLAQMHIAAGKEDLALTTASKRFQASKQSKEGIVKALLNAETTRAGHAAQLEAARQRPTPAKT